MADKPYSWRDKSTFRMSELELTKTWAAEHGFVGKPGGWIYFPDGTPASKGWGPMVSWLKHHKVIEKGKGIDWHTSDRLGNVKLIKWMDRPWETADGKYKGKTRRNTFGGDPDVDQWGFSKDSDLDKDGAMTDKAGTAGGMPFAYPHEHFNSESTEDEMHADWTPEVDPIETQGREPSYWDHPIPDHHSSRISYAEIDSYIAGLKQSFESPTEYTEEDAPYSGKHPLIHKVIKSIEDAGNTQPGDPDYSKVEFPPDHESAPKNAAKEHKPMYSNTDKEYTGQCTGCSWGAHHSPDADPKTIGAHFKRSFDDWHNTGKKAYVLGFPVTSHDMVNDLAMGTMPKHLTDQDKEDASGIADLMDQMEDDATNYVEEPSKKYRREHHMSVNFHSDIETEEDHEKAQHDIHEDRIKTHPLPLLPTEEGHSIKPWSKDGRLTQADFLDSEFDSPYDHGYDEGQTYVEDQLMDGSLSHDEIIEDGENEEGPHASHGYVDDGDAEGYEQFMKGFIKAMYDEIENQASINAGLANPDRVTVAQRKLANMFSSKEEHAANPPESWVAVKVADRAWDLRTKDGVTLGRYPSKKAAEADKTSGFYTRMYDQERRWYAGEQIPNWKPYKESTRHTANEDDFWSGYAHGREAGTNHKSPEDYHHHNTDAPGQHDWADGFHQAYSHFSDPNYKPEPPHDRSAWEKKYIGSLSGGNIHAWEEGFEDAVVGIPARDDKYSNEENEDGSSDAGAYSSGYSRGLAADADMNADIDRLGSLHLAGDSVEMAAIPDCDVCKMENNLSTPAVYDARLPGAGGSWGYVCQRHFDQLGPGSLGTGNGQRLILRKKSSRHLAEDVDWADELLQTDPPCVVCGDRSNNMVKDDYEKGWVPVCDEHRGSDDYVKRYDGDEHPHKGSRHLAATVDKFLEWKAKQGDPINLTTGVPADHELAREIAEWAGDVDLTPQEVEDYVYSKQAALRRQAENNPPPHEIDSDEYRVGYLDGRDWGSDQESGWSDTDAKKSIADEFGGPPIAGGDYEIGYLDGAHAAKPRPSQGQIDKGASLKLAVGARPYIDRQTKQMGWHCKECAIGKKTSQYSEARALADNHNNWYHHELRKRQAMRHQAEKCYHCDKPIDDTSGVHGASFEHRDTKQEFGSEPQKDILSTETPDPRNIGHHAEPRSYYEAPGPSKKNNPPKEGTRTMASRNEAGQQRRTLVAAVATQQKMINALAAQNELLRRGIVTIASAAGITRHPRLAGLITMADNNEPVATSTDEARKPDATDNVDSYGAAPAGANVGVDPDANTDVTQYTVTLPEDAINDLIDVTSPVPGTDAPWPPAVGEQVPTLLTNPDITPMDNMSGWKSSRRHQGTGVYTVNSGGEGDADPRPEDDETEPGGKHTRDPNGISPEDMKAASLWRQAGDGPPEFHKYKGQDEELGYNKQVKDLDDENSVDHTKWEKKDDDDDSKKESSRDPQVRLFAAMKLAKTRIALGMGSGDELADAQRICDDPRMSTAAIRSLTGELDRVTASVQSERRTASRSRVPQRADGVERTMPSVQATSTRHVETSGPGTPTSEEFGDLG